MIEIDNWLHRFTQKLTSTFAERVWFVGLQGSYARDEATESSDIDVVVILDEFSASDIRAYNDMLDSMQHRELICGFISGKQELLNWEPSDLFQFYYDTKPIMGSLDCLLPLLNEDSLSRAIKIGACNIYHGCVHNMLHEKNMDILFALYKSACFVVQAICFKQTGAYFQHKLELLKNIPADERVIVETFFKLKNNAEVNFLDMSETLFVWSKKWIDAAQ